MKLQPLSNRKTGLLLSAGALFAFAFTLAVPATSGAQDYSDARGMANRLNQLEKQVQTLSQSVYRGAPPPADAMAGASGGGVNAATLTMFEDRLHAVEEQQRNMIGQLEKLGFDVRQMQEQMQKAQADTDMRFQQMSATPAAASASSSATTDTPAPTVDDVVKSSGNSSSGTLGTLGSDATTPEALYEAGFADIREQDFDGAQKTFTTFMAKYPTHSLAGNAQYWLAETYYVRGDYRQAAKLFAKGYQEFPKGQKAPDCLLKLGLSLGKLGKKEDACLSLQQLQKEFPGDTSPVNRRAKQEMTQLGCG